MEGLHIDITAIAALWIGGMLLLIPIAGVTARFALKPLLESIARIREARSASRSTEEFELRFALVEQRLGRLTDTVEQWTGQQPAGREPVAACR